MNPAGERVRRALNAIPPSTKLTLPQAAFNFLNSGLDFTATEKALTEALERWADTVIEVLDEPCHMCCPVGKPCPCNDLPYGEDEFCKCDHTVNGNSHWADDGGNNL